MLRIRKDDMVQVLAGKDKGKTGKVISVNPDTSRAIVQGVNLVKKHTRRRRQDDQAGIVKQESSISLSNLAVMCKRCERPVRVGVDVLGDGEKTRFCRKCKETI